jgi:hypothetical protein
MIMFHMAAKDSVLVLLGLFLLQFSPGVQCLTKVIKCFRLFDN